LALGRTDGHSTDIGSDSATCARDRKRVQYIHVRAIPARVLHTWYHARAQAWRARAITTVHAGARMERAA